jgi:uroporphyrin-III C-methyltransferase/precorrin-2 dehydrogenase/sirohydrochlorin ferrochelatase
MMALERIGAFADVLIEHGRPAATPVAVICDGTMRTQRAVHTTLADVAAEVRTQGLRPPAIVVIGEVAGLRH